jgi:hypothetical protein
MYLSWDPGDLTQFCSRLFALRNAVRSVWAIQPGTVRYSDILQVHLVTVEIGVIR